MSLNSSTAAGTVKTATVRQVLKMLVKLFKFRIVLLLLWAALGGAFLGAGGFPGFKEILVLLVTGALAAGGASAINQYLEQDTDAKMRRTRKRPLPDGQIENTQAVFWIALAMVLAGVLIVLPTNPIMALYLALGAAIYVGVYTIWLKPRSVMNIVIGGAAGSCAVMTGGAAVGAASDPGVIVLALLLFLWTPAHFWALALFYKEDYAKASVPMLPVLTTDKYTGWWIFVHAASTGLAAIVLAAHPSLGVFYLIPAAIITGVMLTYSVQLIADPTRKRAIRLFVTSNIFLAMILLSIMLVAIGRQVFMA